jgi:hypothetical protein
MLFGIITHKTTRNVMKVMMNLFDDVPDDRVGATTAAEPTTMPPPSRAPLAGGGDDWLPTARPSRARWLLIAAACPWVVLAAMFVGGRPAASPDAHTSVPADGPPPEMSVVAPEEPDPVAGQASEPGPADAPPQGGAGGADLADLLVITSTEVPDTRTRAVGLAALAARTWLSSLPSAATIPGIGHHPNADHQYVEHVTIESIDQPARGAAVITIHALVLPVGSDGYGPPRAVRLAVPVAFDARDAWLAGQPWMLPTPDTVVRPLEATAIDDPDLQLAAIDAIERAGWQVTSLERLARTAGWPLVATARAIPPGHDDEVEVALWLRVEVDRLVVAGTAPAPDTPHTQEQP